MTFSLEDKKKTSFGKGLTLSQTSLGFLHVCNTSLLITLWEKEKLLVTSNFSFSHSVFFPLGQFLLFLLNCRVQSLSILKILKFVVWERVKALLADLHQHRPQVFSLRLCD